MIGKQYRNLAAALMVAAGLGLAGHAGSTANAQPETAGCNDPAMMGDQMLQARDGQCLAGQTLSVRAAFAAAWGDHAGARWAAEHEAELALLGR